MTTLSREVGPRRCAFALYLYTSALLRQPSVYVGPLLPRAKRRSRIASGAPSAWPPCHHRKTMSGLRVSTNVIAHAMFARRAHGVVASHLLRTRKALGSNPSVSSVLMSLLHTRQPALSESNNLCRHLK